MTALSVVLISKNQEWNIGRLIESALRETACVSRREVVLVDSDSSDCTVAKASRYPIRVLRLHGGQKLTPAAGRYVGYKQTNNELILFLDGDMELCRGWLERALALLRQSRDIGVVTGKIVDLPKAAQPGDRPLPETLSDPIHHELQFAGGAALYRRAVLEEVGSFNPYLNSDEEPELCLRIRQAGYRVVQLGYPIVYHYSDPSWSLLTLIGRWRRNLYLGAGQNIRYLLGTSLLWSYLWERGYGCAPALGLVAALISLLRGLRSGRWRFMQAWLLLMGTLFGAEVLRKGSVHRATFSFLHRILILDGTVRGFLTTPQNPEQYPCKLDVIK